ncbi:ricin-type beta-trefoil lectin domain protein [Microbulbifer sp. THAF38]|uniref:ricin-type beta-trefoil lectin domain protein n=1 Tax=Microbulbifer sp. THAF38 TaxID=2587856 RepID=UPI001267CC3F|nr:ricin-type beta-trefoil lectin domain protein [Microbulbifer sp. THAF38]QFT55406.1 Endo-1,4-beta-xylanase A precursor [Microbulbifer sp. THAF38]
MPNKIIFSCLFSLILFFSANTHASTSPSLQIIADAPQEQHRIDQLYYLQPHNSYERLEAGETLTDWLDKGFRSLELDVVDHGPWQGSSYGPYVAHGQSDIGNHMCSSNGSDDRLIHCLNDIKAWLANNELNAPLMLYIDMKPDSNWFAAWYADEIYLLDQYIKQQLGELQFSYQDLLAHLEASSPSSDYRSTLKNIGWPTLGELLPRGKKVLVMFTGGQSGNVNNRMESALDNYNLHAFLCPDIDTADPEEFSGNIDSIDSNSSKRIFCGNVKAGDHYQVTANEAANTKQLMHLWNSSGDFSNTDFGYAYLAVAHGATAIGMDPSTAANTPSYTSQAIPFVGVRRSLPGYMRLRSASNSNLCMTVSQGYSNGSNLTLSNCNTSNEQQFVYTAEGQLRPKGNNKYCVDYNTGSADNGDKMHLWDCDGGNSEKWQIQQDGTIQNRDKDWSYCIDTPGSSAEEGERLQIYKCSNNDINQQFLLEVVADWKQNSF